MNNVKPKYTQVCVLLLVPVLNAPEVVSAVLALNAILTDTKWFLDMLPDAN